MEHSFESLLKAALSLPEMQRVLLIDELVESLPPDTGPYSEEEMHAELMRRRAEYEKDPSKGIPWSEFRWDEGE